MARWILRRLLACLVVLVGVSIIAFMLPRLTPGDPVLTLMEEGATKEMLDQARAFWGLNEPLLVQYFIFFTRALTGDLGQSIASGQPISLMISRAFPNTLFLALSAWLWAVLLGIPLGVVAALNRNKLTDLVIRFLALLGRGMPHFWLGIMLILLFAVTLHLLPTSGIGEAGVSRIRHLILPSFVLGTGILSLVVRMARSEMLEVLGQDYIRTARAKGLHQGLILYRHALKNALIPVITVLGIEIGAVMGGAIVTETVFAYPGLGRLAVESIYGKDYPMIQSLVLFFSAMYIVANIITDILYAYLDPRIRYS